MSLISIRQFENASNILFGNTSEADSARASFHRAFDAVFDSTNSFPFAVGPSLNVDLTDMHPTGTQILQLWQIYLNNIDPLLKLTHTPTLQKRVIEASGRISSRLSIDKDLEALLFNIYFISINSLTETESEVRFGVAKSSLQARYHVASQQALLNANLMRTLDLSVMQAFMLHLVCVMYNCSQNICGGLITGPQTSIRIFVDPRTHYVLIGIAVRIAVRLGLHRDGTQFKLSPFDAEQRRRVWWNLVALDKRIAETTGSAVTAMSTYRADCKRPFNLNDSDLYPHAKHPPQASNVSTEMVFCLARYELAATAAPDGSNSVHTLLTRTTDRTDHDRPSAAGDTGSSHRGLRVGLEEYANYVETTYLRSLDPSVPLHQFTILMTRQNLRKLQLLANVSNILRESAPLAELRQWAFDESLRLLEDDNILQSTPQLQCWLWYTHMHFPFPAYMFLVHELKRNCAGEKCARAWEAMDRNHRLRGLVGSGKKGSPMHIAYGKHFLEAWNARVQANRRNGRVLQTPEVVAMIQQIHQPTQLQHRVEQPAAPPFAGLPQELQMWQGWYGSYGLDELDPLASLGDISGMEYVTPSLI